MRVEPLQDDERNRLWNEYVRSIENGFVPIWAEQGSVVLSPKEQERRRKFWEHERAKSEKRDKEEQYKQWYKDKPKFYFASAEGHFTDIKPATAARLFYLGAHMDYHNGTLKRNKKALMKYDDLQSVLGLAKNAKCNFWNEVNGKYLFADADGVLHMPDEFFHRGEFKTDRTYQQIFIDSVKRLYELTPARKHQYLGYVFQLIPYINWEFNILCHNVEETDLDKIERLTVDEFCEAVGYSRENRQKLLRIYRDNITFAVEGKHERFLSFVTDGVDLESARIFVNPHILYHGHIPRYVWILGDFCRLEN